MLFDEAELISRHSRHSVDDSNQDRGCKRLHCTTVVHMQMCVLGCRSSHWVKTAKYDSHQLIHSESINTPQLILGEGELSNSGSGFVWSDSRRHCTAPHAKPHPLHPPPESSSPLTCLWGGNAQWILFLFYDESRKCLSLASKSLWSVCHWPLIHGSYIRERAFCLNCCVLGCVRNKGKSDTSSLAALRNNDCICRVLAKGCKCGEASAFKISKAAKFV